MKLFKQILLGIVVIVMPIAASAQEVCGIEGVTYNNLFKNGFEALLLAAQQKATTEHKAPSSVDMGRPMGIAPVPYGGTPTITITDPASSGSIAGRTLQLRGTISGPINTGVSVNGIPAFVQGNQFVTPLLTLPSSGSTSMTATATTLDGATATDSKTLTASASNGVRLISPKPAEFFNRPVKFALEVDSAISIQQLTVDFNGDGTPEFTGTDPLLVPNTYTYAQPGFYTAEARITTNQSTILVSKTIHAANDVTELRTRACSVYGALRARLIANDVLGAINVFPADNRSLYQAMFNALGSNRPVFAGRLGTIATGLLSLHGASMTVITTDEGQPQAYRVRIEQGGDGVWRIEEL